MHDLNGDCTECSFRYWMDADGNCHKVDDNCEDWDPANGDCTDCYPGYIVVDGACERDEEEQIPPAGGDVPEGCHSYDHENQVCMECSFRWYYDEDSDSCQPVSDQCKNWNTDGDCTCCYDGYDLADGECVRADGEQPPAGGDGNCDNPDPYCYNWDCEANVCVECAQRTVPMEEGCTPVDDLCKDWNLFGECTDCYQGYIL